MLETGSDLSAWATEWRGDRFAPEPPSAAEIAAARRDLAEAPDEVRADLPDWCVPHFQAAFDEDWVREGAALAARPPLDLRVNTLLAHQPKILGALTEFGVESMRLAPHGLRIPPIQGQGRHPNVQAEPAFQQGFFEIQDEGSQVASVMAAPLPGQTVLDFCAGGGGKTLALAAAMANSGRIVAYDAEKPRLAPIFDRLRRAGTSNVEVRARCLRPRAGGRPLHRLGHMAAATRCEMAPQPQAALHTLQGAVRDP